MYQNELRGNNHVAFWELAIKCINLRKILLLFSCQHHSETEMNSRITLIQNLFTCPRKKLQAKLTSDCEDSEEVSRLYIDIKTC